MSRVGTYSQALPSFSPLPKSACKSKLAKLLNTFSWAKKKSANHTQADINALSSTLDLYPGQSSSNRPVILSSALNRGAIMTVQNEVAHLPWTPAASHFSFPCTSPPGVTLAPSCKQIAGLESLSNHHQQAQLITSLSPPLPRRNSSPGFIANAVPALELELPSALCLDHLYQVASIEPHVRPSLSERPCPPPSLGYIDRPNSLHAMVYSEYFEASLNAMPKVAPSPGSRTCSASEECLILTSTEQSSSSKLNNSGTPLRIPGPTRLIHHAPKGNPTEEEYATADDVEDDEFYFRRCPAPSHNEREQVLPRFTPASASQLSTPCPRVFGTPSTSSPLLVNPFPSIPMRPRIGETLVFGSDLLVLRPSTPDLDAQHSTMMEFSTPKTNTITSKLTAIQNVKHLEDSETEAAAGITHEYSISSFSGLDHSLSQSSSFSSTFYSSISSLDATSQTSDNTDKRTKELYQALFSRPYKSLTDSGETSKILSDDQDDWSAQNQVRHSQYSAGINRQWEAIGGDFDDLLLHSPMSVYSRWSRMMDYGDVVEDEMIGVAM